MQLTTGIDSVPMSANKMSCSTMKRLFHIAYGLGTLSSYRSIKKRYQMEIDSGFELKLKVIKDASRILHFALKKVRDGATFFINIDT